MRIQSKNIHQLIGWKTYLNRFKGKRKFVDELEALKIKPHGTCMYVFMLLVILSAEFFLLNQRLSLTCAQSGLISPISWLHPSSGHPVMLRLFLLWVCAAPSCPTPSSWSSSSKSKQKIMICITILSTRSDSTKWTWCFVKIQLNADGTKEKFSQQTTAKMIDH